MNLISVTVLSVQTGIITQRAACTCVLSSTLRHREDSSMKFAVRSPSVNEKNKQTILPSVNLS